jgi:predicted membrane protein (TIGR00267 family)
MGSAHVMNSLTDEEQERLFRAVNKIHSNKLVLIKGYRLIAAKSQDKRIQYLLNRVIEDEENNARFWSERIKELQGRDVQTTGRLLRDMKIRIMMLVLGIKGFFEWAVIGEDEGVHELTILAGTLNDQAESETWSRYATDERMHLERMKSEVLGMEAWEIRGGGGVRDMIFGANDGLVSTLAFVAGVVGAITDPYLVLLSGIAELFAGTISMGFGSYQSSKSELEVLERDDQKNTIGVRKVRTEEIEELIHRYQAEGFKRNEAEALVKRIIAEKEMPLSSSALEAIGLAPEERGNPVKAGVLCGVSFGLAAIVPIFPFAIGALNCVNALAVSTGATLATLFGVGAMKTIFSRKNWVRSGLEMMVIGASAAAITYLIGTAFSVLVEA